jgi:hypothetical protein
MFAKSGFRTQHEKSEMSFEENKAIVRRSIEAFNAGDLGAGNVTVKTFGSNSSNTSTRCHGGSTRLTSRT